MKKTFLLALLPAAILTTHNLNAQSCPKWGPYVGAKFQSKETADLLMAEVMTPAEGNAPYTYTCAVQFGIGKSGGYCGLQNKNGKGEHNVPLNNIFSVWDFPNKVQIRAVYKDPMTFVGGFGHEGTGLHSHCDFGWVPGQWYTHVVRRWYTGGDKTQVGYFIYDHTKKEWRHYVTFEVPEADAKLRSGISSFLENFADEKKTSRISNYRSYWQLTTGNQWIHADSLVADAGEGFWDVKATGNNGVQLTSCGPTFIKKTKATFPVKESMDKPSVIKPAEIYDAGVYYDKTDKTMYVNWSVNTAGAPQLSYDIKVYDNEAKSGTPVAVKRGTDPDTRSIAIPTPNLSSEKKTYYLVMQVTDIFNQQSAPRDFILEELQP